MVNTINIKKTAIVTGAAGGIGSAIAKTISPHVEHLILIDINKLKLMELNKKLEQQFSVKSYPYVCDVSDSIAVNNIILDIEIEIGLPNIVINNARIGGPFHRIDEVSDNEWFNIINTNLKSVFNLSKAVLPKMKQQKFGRIINVASVQGYFGASLSSTYVASKHGVIGYTRAIAAEWGEFGITCNAICPGYVDTRMGIQNDNIEAHYQNVIAKTPSKRIAKPHEVAELIVHLIKDEASFMNGSILTIDGGLTCHLVIS